MKYAKLSRRQSRQSGFTLIEILITVFIIAIGFLGMASMQTISLSQNQSAYLKSQASVLVNDMADRLRMNIDLALTGSYDATTTDPATAPALAAAQLCREAATRCSPAQQVVLDQAEWAARVNGANGGIALLPGALGTVTRNGNVFTITVGWQEKAWRGTAENADNENALGFVAVDDTVNYGNQQLVVSLTL